MIDRTAFDEDVFGSVMAPFAEWHGLQAWTEAMNSETVRFSAEWRALSLGLLPLVLRSPYSVTNQEGWSSLEKPCHILTQCTKPPLDLWLRLLGCYNADPCPGVEGLFLPTTSFTQHISRTQGMERVSSSSVSQLPWTCYLIWFQSTGGWLLGDQACYVVLLDNLKL